jgi:hypothetical protein
LLYLTPCFVILEFADTISTEFLVDYGTLVAPAWLFFDSRDCDILELLTALVFCCCCVTLINGSLVLPKDPVRLSSKVDSVSCLTLLVLNRDCFFCPSRFAKEGYLVIGRTREWVPPKLISLRLIIEQSDGDSALLISAIDFLFRLVCDFALCLKQVESCLTASFFELVERLLATSY